MQNSSKETQNIPLEKNADPSPNKSPITEKNIINKSIYFSFYITFVFLATTATITFIEAIRTSDPNIRHVMNLETCISIIASFFYSVFIYKIDNSIKKNTAVDWNDFYNPFYVIKSYYVFSIQCETSY